MRRALAALFGGAVSKDMVSRVWRKVQGDWEVWKNRSLADEPIVRLILDGTVVRVRFDRKATSISLRVVLGVRADGQKVLLAVNNMDGETTEVRRSVLDDLVKRGLRKPDRPPNAPFVRPASPMIPLMPAAEPPPGASISSPPRGFAAESSPCNLS